MKMESRLSFNTFDNSNTNNNYSNSLMRRLLPWCKYKATCKVLRDTLSCDELSTLKSKVASRKVWKYKENEDINPVVSFINKGDGCVSMDLNDRIMVNENQLYSMSNLSNLSNISTISTSSYLLGSNWFYGRLCRDTAISMLSNKPLGSFIVRESTSKTGCYALSVRVPKRYTQSGVAHYLILVNAKGRYKIKVQNTNFTKEFSSLQSLIIHHSIMQELLPCPLNLSSVNWCPNKCDHSARYESNYDDQLLVDIDSDPDYQRILTQFRQTMANSEIFLLVNIAYCHLLINAFLFALSAKYHIYYHLKSCRKFAHEFRSKKIANILPVSKLIYPKPKNGCILPCPIKVNVDIIADKLIMENILPKRIICTLKGMLSYKFNLMRITENVSEGYFEANKRGLWLPSLMLKQYDKIMRVISKNPLCSLENNKNLESTFICNIKITSEIDCLYDRFIFPYGYIECSIDIIPIQSTANAIEIKLNFYSQEGHYYKIQNFDCQNPLSKLKCNGSRVYILIENRSNLVYNCTISSSLSLVSILSSWQSINNPIRSFLACAPFLLLTFLYLNPSFYIAYYSLSFHHIWFISFYLISLVMAFQYFIVLMGQFWALKTWQGKKLIIIPVSSLIDDWTSLFILAIYVSILPSFMYYLMNLEPYRNISIEEYRLSNFTISNNNSFY